MTVIARDDVTLALVTDVASTAHYFQLKASTASAPTVPTVYPAPSPWVTTEPTYTEGATNSLYTVDVTVFSDGTFDYTPVSLSSSYEAAKAAYNKAQQAQSTATAAQTTADGKNKIFSSESEPSHTGIVPGDMWFQLDTNNNVSGIQVWNGSAFTDMVLLANELLVASSVGTTQIADNAIVTGKIAANAITALQIAAQTITGDKLDVGSVAAAIVTSGKFQTATSGARVVMDSNGIKAYDASGNVTFQVDASTGQTTMTGAIIQTTPTGDAVTINPEIASPVVGKPWISQDGMTVQFRTNSVKSPALSGYSQKTVNGAISSMDAISMYSGKTDANSGEGFVYAQSDPGNTSAGFEAYDKDGNFGAGAWAISDGHLYLCGFRANGMWSARDYEPVYRLKLDTASPSQGQAKVYSLTYAYPVPFGNRNVIGTAESGANGMVFTARNFSASGFNACFYNASGGGSNLFVNFIAPWIYGGIEWA